MKKSLILGLSSVALSVVSLSASADMHKSGSNWYAGVGGSWVVTKQTNRTSLETEQDTYNPIDGIPASPQEKTLDMEDSTGLAGTLLIGHKFDYNSWNMFTELGYTFDSTEAKKSTRFHHAVGGDTGFEVTLKRNHTFSFGVGVSKNLTHTIDAFFKLSALYTQFDLDTKVSDITNTGDKGHATKKVWRFGWAPTVGLSKDLGSGYSARADYSYQMYSQVKEGALLNGKTLANTNSRINPTYHVFGLTLTKAL